MDKKHSRNLFFYKSFIIHGKSPNMNSLLKKIYLKFDVEPWSSIIHPLHHSCMIDLMKQISLNRPHFKIDVIFLNFVKKTSGFTLKQPCYHKITTSSFEIASFKSLICKTAFPSSAYLFLNTGRVVWKTYQNYKVLGIKNVFILCYCSFKKKKILSSLSYEHTE